MGIYNHGNAFHKGPGGNIDMDEAFHRFVSQQPMLSKGGYESQSKYSENHNVEFETISSHSNTNTAKMLNRNRQPITIQSRRENDSSMAAPLGYAGSRSYLQNSNLSSSLHEESRLSNSQSMRLRASPIVNQTATHKFGSSQILQPWTPLWRQRPASDG